MTPPQQIQVLLLSESEAMAALDRRALRDAGVDRVECLTSGVAAARMLAGLDPLPFAFHPDVTVCSQRLSDMDGEQFCAILRLHPMLLDMPVLLILPHDSEVEQLRTLGCGASALLARPYSIAMLKGHLDALAASRPTLEELEKAGRLTDTRAFDDALATYGILLKPVRQPEDYFRVGMQCLEQRKWNSAINAFQRAMRGALIQGKAELGMAAAWRGKGDMAQYRQYLALAAATFVRARQWNRARAVYGRLLQEDPEARSPFLSAALQQIRQGNYDLAAEVLSQGYEITPRQQISERMAQICLAADAPESMLKSMEGCLEKVLGADAEALNGEIRVTLENLARETEAKKLEDAAERQWRAGRQAAREREEGESAATDVADNKSPAAAQERAGGARGGSSRGEAHRRGPVGIAPAEEEAWSTTAQKGGGSLRAGQGATAPVVSLWGEHDDAPAQAPQRNASNAATEAAPQGSPIPPVLDPLALGKNAGGPLNAKSSFSDMLSVVRLTWNLTRRK